MNERLKGRVALVTGAASGIGRAIALRLAEDGASVAVVDIDVEGAQNTAQAIQDLQGKAVAIKCDVCREEQVNQSVRDIEDRLDKIGILVNCAGAPGANLIDNMTLDEWISMFNINCNGVFLFSKAIIKSMKEGDRIINIASISGVQGQVAATNYAAAKGAIIAFTKSLALEVGHQGITANTIAPGIIRTAMTSAITDYAPDIAKEIPMLRFGEPEDIASLTAFLASREAGYLTGELIVVDGGLSLANPLNRFTANLMELN